MSVYKGPSVAISGNVFFNNPGKKPAVLWVFTGKPQTYKIPGMSWPFIIAAKKIPAVGYYEVRVPKNIGEVYVIAQEGAPVFSCSADGSRYLGRPVIVGAQDVKGIDVKATSSRSQ